MQKVEKVSKSVSTRPILLGSVKRTSKWPCLEYICIVRCMSMYTTSYTTHITFHNLPHRVLVSYVVCICYVKGCKFSTSTHDNYRIVSNIVSAICGYFYGFQNPSGGSEIVYIVKKVEKKLNPCRPVCRVTFFRDIRLYTKQYRLSHGRLY